MGAARSVFVDSGGWLALFRARDAHHAESEALLRKAIRERRPLLTTNLVMAEVQRLVLHRVGVRAARACLQHIEDSPTASTLFATGQHHEGAFEWLDKLNDQSISYTDAVSFAVMKSERIKTAITFDNDFSIAGFERFQA